MVEAYISLMPSTLALVSLCMFSVPILRVADSVQTVQEKNSLNSAVYIHNPSGSPVN